MASASRAGCLSGAGWLRNRVSVGQPPGGPLCPQTPRARKEGRWRWSFARCRTRDPTRAPVPRGSFRAGSDRPHSGVALLGLQVTTAGNLRSAISHRRACASRSGRSTSLMARHSARYGMAASSYAQSRAVSRCCSSSASSASAVTTARRPAPLSAATTAGRCDEAPAERILAGGAAPLQEYVSHVPRRPAPTRSLPREMTQSGRWSRVGSAEGDAGRPTRPRRNSTSGRIKTGEVVVSLRAPL